MKLVLQGQYNNGCQLSCIAMLTNKTMEEIFNVFKDECPSDKLIREYLLLNNIELEKGSHITQGFGKDCIGYFVKHYRTLWCSVNSWKEGWYGHAILIHESNIYDPAKGMNPLWESHRYISRIRTVIYEGEI